MMSNEFPVPADKEALALARRYGEVLTDVILEMAAAMARRDSALGTLPRVTGYYVREAATTLGRTVESAIATPSDAMGLVYCIKLLRGLPLTPLA